MSWGLSKMMLAITMRQRMNNVRRYVEQRQIGHRLIYAAHGGLQMLPMVENVYYTTEQQWMLPTLILIRYGLFKTLEESRLIFST